MRSPSAPYGKTLRGFLSTLVDQMQAQTLVSPYQDALGFWFGGGNLVQGADGAIWLTGRYRNAGDSRTGLQAGERGLECALLRSDDGGRTFGRVCVWSKADLSRDGREVISVEGTSLHRRTDGDWELFISSEKALPYPEPLEHYRKPGTGVWTIDRMAGPSPDRLDPTTLETVLQALDRPEFLHVKDPVVLDGAAGDTWMLFCSHPYCWTSSNSGWAVRGAGQGQFHVRTWQVIPRGTTWDVAVARLTDRLSVPQTGLFAGQPPCAVYFYDGAECVRSHEQNPLARKRPRGYSCEEIGGAAWGWDAGWPELERLSRLEPLFISPWGTGASRYVHTLTSSEGILATWEQSQADGSQPLVGRWLPMSDVERILSGE